MEEIKEKSAKKPVSMRLTATASERLMHIIDLYKNLEDPKGEHARWCRPARGCNEAA